MNERVIQEAGKVKEELLAGVPSAQHTEECKMRSMKEVYALMYFTFGKELKYYLEQYDENTLLMREKATDKHFGTINTKKGRSPKVIFFSWAKDYLN